MPPVAQRSDLGKLHSYTFLFVFFYVYLKNYIYVCSIVFIFDPKIGYFWPFRDLYEPKEWSRKVAFIYFFVYLDEIYKINRRNRQELYKK